MGQPASVTVRAYHQDGINSINFVEDDDFLNKQQNKICAPATTCVFTTTVEQNYQGEKLLYANLLKYPRAFVAEEYKAVPFVCDQEYCQPDPEINAFMEWMRYKGYGECVVSQYLGWSTAARENAILKDFLRERPSGITNPFTVNFYDVVPADSEATYRSVGAGEGGDCQASPSWPDWWPTPAPADYLFLERHFERTLGIDINFTYQRLDIDYTQTLGEPTLSNGVYQFGSRYSFIQQFPEHSIVHYAIQTYNGLPVGDMTGASHLAEVSLEPFNTLGATTFTHEWGHTWGMPHPFYGDPRLWLQMDGIMGNTYGHSSNLTDPTDPLERFVLEPAWPGVYADDATFAASYTSGLIGSYLLPSCDGVDLAVVSARWVSEGAEAHVFEATLTNHGPIAAAYVKLAVTDSTQPSYHYASRILQQLAPGETRIETVTVPKINMLSPTVVFTLDRDNAVDETNEANNTASATRPLPPCVDADGDGFPRDYILCQHSMCPLYDCNDSSAQANPSRNEGPSGTATCLDGLDNNCNSLIDGWDTVACSYDRKGSDYQTGPGSIVQGNDLRTHDSDDLYEVLKEGLSGDRSRLTHVWRFDGVPAASGYQLILEGNRPTNAEGDNFQFAFSTNGTSFTDITGAVISKVFEQQGGGALPFSPGPHSGTIYIRVQDTHSRKGAIQLDTVRIDYLIVRALP